VPGLDLSLTVGYAGRRIDAAQLAICADGIIARQQRSSRLSSGPSRSPCAVTIWFSSKGEKL